MFARGAGHFGRQWICTTGQNLPSDYGVLEEDEKRRGNETGYEKHGRIRTPKALLAKDIECCRQIAEGFGFGENQHQSKIKAGGGQGDDKTVDARFYYQHSVHPSHQSAGRKAALMVASCGSGTALIKAQGDSYAHVSGSAVGGGTMLGLARLILGTMDPLEIEDLAAQGDRNGADLSLAEAYDLSTALELDWYEQLGLCAKGEAEQLLRSCATTIGGRIPVNASGGLACFGEAIPAQAIAQVCELTWQLKGQATGRQVEGATVGITANQGLFGHGSSVIIAR